LIVAAIMTAAAMVPQRPAPADEPNKPSHNDHARSQPADLGKDPILRKLQKELQRAGKDVDSRVLVRLMRMDISPVQDDLLRMLDSRRPKLYTRILWVLRNSGDPNTIDRMIDHIGRIPPTPKPTDQNQIETRRHIWTAQGLGRAIGFQAGPEHVKPLMHWARKGNLYQVAAALEGLRRVGGPAQARTLLQLVRDAETDDPLLLHGDSTFETIAAMGQSDVVDALIRIVKTNEDLRPDATDALCDIADPKVLAYMCEALDNPENPWQLRLEAADILGELPYTPPPGRGPGKRIRVLRKALDDPEDIVAEYAAISLGKLGDRASSERIRQMAERQMTDLQTDGGLPDYVPDAVIALAYLRDANAVTHMQAIEYGETFSGIWQIRDVFAEHPLPGGEKLAMEELWPIAGGRDRERLIEELLRSYLDKARATKDNKTFGRIEAFLVEQVADKPSAGDVRKPIIGLLAHIRSPAAVKPLLTSLTSGDANKPGQRAAIFRALGQIGDANALPILRPLLRADERALKTLAPALASLGAKDLSQTLLPLTRHEDWKVRVRAIRALYVDPTDSVRKRLRALLDSPADIERQAAVESLGKIRDANSLELLRRAMHRDPSCYVRARAAVALAQLGDRASLPTIRRRVERTRAPVAVYLYTHAAILLAPKEAPRWILQRIRKQRGRVSYSLVKHLHEGDPDVVRTVLAELHRWPWSGMRYKASHIADRLRRRLCDEKLPPRP
jgi:HEAT repeat protein